METLSKIKHLLSGSKSYIVGFLTIAIGFYLKDGNMISTGLGIITIRAGISKAIPPATA
jgi:hypothetical protein